jgi:hypothetical protein
MATTEIFDQRRNQDYVYLEKADPKIKNAIKRLIIDFDFENSPLQIVKKYQGDCEKLLSELKNLNVKREIFLAKITSELTM